MTRNRPKRRLRPRPSGGRIERDAARPFLRARGFRYFSTRVHASRLRRASATLPRRVLPLLEPGAHDSPRRARRWQRAPLPVLEGAAALLIARVFRRRAPKLLVEPYLEYARCPRTRDRINRMRRARVRPAHTGPQGRHFDLHQMFDDLNGRYFEGQLQRPQIGWSRRSWRRQFGCYDPGPNQILLNRRMDRPKVPRFAVEYVLFHEMLHVKHPTRRSGCSLVSHSREFREEEKRFEHFAPARRVLDRLAC